MSAHLRRLYVIGLLGPVIVSAIALGCTSASPSPDEERRVGGPDVEDVLEHFARAWNEGDFEAVRAVFWPARRQLLDAEEGQIRRSMRAWTIERWRVAETCNPRGAYWVYAHLERRARLDMTTGDVDGREVVWLRFDRERWWMYSL